MAKVKDFEHEEENPTQEELDFYQQTLYIQQLENAVNYADKTMLIVECIKALRDVIDVEAVDEKVKKEAEKQLITLIKSIKVEQEK